MGTGGRVRARARLRGLLQTAPMPAIDLLHVVLAAAALVLIVDRDRAGARSARWLSPVAPNRPPLAFALGVLLATSAVFDIAAHQALMAITHFIFALALVQQAALQRYSLRRR